MVGRPYRLFVVALAVSALSIPLTPPLSSPVVLASGTVASLRTGRWSDAATWNAGRVPAQGDSVVITAGTTVTYDRFTDVEMAQVLILGKLTFSRTAGTRLDTGNVIVERGGHLDMGTPTEPIPAFIDAELRLVTRPSGTCVGGPMFNANDVGLWVMPGGRWDTHGGAVRHTWVKLQGDVGAGATILRVKENVADWEPGSTILVTPTSLGLALNEFEEVQIARVIYAGDHSEIFLSQPLRYAHAGGTTTAGEVALLSRNVVVTSKYPTYPMQAHTMYMGAAAGSIAYTEFRDLGTFGCLTRYPVHFHMTGDASRGMSVRGASIWRTDNNFMNLHAANGVLVEDVVGYDTTGIGFYIGEPEAGMMTVDNVFIHNLAAKVVFRPGGLNQTQQRASGFWIESRNSALIDNVASGSYGTSKVDSGFHFEGGVAPVVGFRSLVMVRNEAHSNKSNGLHSWLNSKDPFMVLDFRAWRNGRAGVSWGAYTTRWQLHRARLYENGEANLISTVIRMFTQDSELYGSPQFPTPIGIYIGGYFLNNDPTLPVKVLRNVLAGHRTDLFQIHTPCAFGAEQLNPFSRDCSATYLLAEGNRWGSPQAIDFGWHMNANSWILVRGWAGSAALPANFRLTRKDRPRPDVDAYYYAPFDAWLDPMTASTVVQASASSVVGQSAAGIGGASGAGSKTAGGSSGGGSSSGKPRPAPTRTPVPGPTGSPGPAPGGSSMPPAISLSSPTEGSLLTGSVVLEAAASSVNPIVKVEFFADEKLLATLTAAPYHFVWSTSSWTRKRAYVYACATDSAANTACTFVAKVNRTAP